MASPNKQPGQDRSMDLVRLLALASFLPFLFLAAMMVLVGAHSTWSSVAIDGFKTWSAIVLALLGGIRWGLALRADQTRGAPIAFAAFAALVGWVALFAPGGIGVGILLLAHCAQGAWDSISAQRGATPAWFGTIRIVWTLLVAAAHIAVFAAIY